MYMPGIYESQITDQEIKPILYNLPFLFIEQSETIFILRNTLG